MVNSRKLGTVILIFCLSLSLARIVFAAGRPVACQTDHENSQTITRSLTGSTSLGDVVFGTEKQCLDERHLNINGSAHVDGAAVDQYYNSCAYRGRSQFASIAELRNALSLRGRDLLVDGLWQEVAHRSHAQLVCRQSTLYVYNHDQTKQTRLNARSKAVFDQVKGDIRELIRRQAITPEVAANEVSTRLKCNENGLVQRKVCNDIAAAEAQRDSNQFATQIAAKLSLIPFGYEPSVAAALLEMAEYDTFSPERYQAAMAKAQSSYRELDRYWDDKRKPTGNGSEEFCITREFKEKAAQGDYSSMDEFLNSIPQQRLSTPRNSAVQCYIRSHYRDVPLRTSETRQLVVGGAAIAAAGISAFATGGTSLSILASLGIDSVLFVDQLDKAIKACTAENFTVSPTGAETCDAEKAFQREAEQSEPTKCGPEAAWAGIAAIPLVGAGVRAALNTTRAAGAGAEIVEGQRALATMAGREAAAASVEGEEIVVNATRRPRTNRTNSPNINTTRAQASPAPLSRRVEDAYRPVNVPAAVDTSDVIATTASEQSRLRQNGIGFRETDIETQLQANVVDFNQTSLATRTGQPPNYGKVLEVTSLPPAGRATSVTTNAFVHPQMQSYLDRLRAMGYRLVVDTSIPHTGTNAYLQSSTKILALRPDSTWQTFLHEFQHAEFAHFVEPQFASMQLKAISGGKIADLLDAPTAAAIGQGKTQRLQALLERGLPKNAVDETLAADAELTAMGFRRYVPFLGSNTEKYALRHQITDLQNLSSLTETQQQTLNAAKRRYQLLTGYNVGSVGAAVSLPAAGIAASRLLTDRDPNSYEQIVYDEHGHTFAQRADKTWVSLKRP